MALITTHANSVSLKHPEYTSTNKAWKKIRDCLKGEDKIKAETTLYLPQPEGMQGEFAAAYDAYLERAHFPLITSYALSGALGLVITKLPEFHLPAGLEYLKETATRDGKSITSLFLDIVIEIFKTGRVPVLVDFLKEKSEFRFVQYSAEEFINWKLGSFTNSENHGLLLGVIKEQTYEDETNLFSHETEDEYRVLYLNNDNEYCSQIFRDGKNIPKDEDRYEDPITPIVYGNTFDKIPLVVAGSIDNDFRIQPIPLISVANCSVQIYRKEADLANSEYLSCNPTLVIVGASNDDDLPNVVGSSVMMVIPNEAARVFYTTTDTAALTHVKDHIKDLYEEAIRHGVAILDARKGVEAAEALRIRQSTQSSTIFSIYMSAVNVIKTCLEYMCEWGGHNKEEIAIDTPNSLNTGFPDAGILKSLVLGTESGSMPLMSIYKYSIDTGLLDQSISYKEYIQMLESGEMENFLNRKEGGSNGVDVVAEFKRRVREEKDSVGNSNRASSEDPLGALEL